jgi:hypothetical protein
VQRTPQPAFAVDPFEGGLGSGPLGEAPTRAVCSAIRTWGFLFFYLKKTGNVLLCTPACRLALRDDVQYRIERFLFLFCAQKDSSLSLGRVVGRKEEISRARAGESNSFLASPTGTNKYIAPRRNFECTGYVRVGVCV